MTDLSPHADAMGAPADLDLLPAHADLRPAAVALRARRRAPSCGTATGKRVPRLPVGPRRDLASATPTRRWPTPSPSRPAPCCTCPTCSAPSRAGGGGHARRAPATATPTARGTRRSSATRVPRPTRPPSSWPASSGGRGRHDGGERLRRRSTAARSPPCTPPASPRSGRRSSRCPRASATCRGTTSTRSSAALDATVAAVLLEPVQGEGGVNPATAEYFQGVRRLCDERGILFMVDEVQTGLGRTGEWFGFQHFGVRPDVVTMAKALGNGVPDRRLRGHGRGRRRLRARRPRHHLRRPAPRHVRGPGRARRDGPHRRRRRPRPRGGAAAPRALLGAAAGSREVRGLGLLLAAELESTVVGRQGGRGRAARPGLVVNARHRHRAAAGPAAHRHRRRDRRGRRHHRRRARRDRRDDPATRSPTCGTSSRSTTSRPASWPGPRPLRGGARPAAGRSPARRGALLREASACAPGTPRDGRRAASAATRSRSRTPRSASARREPCRGHRPGAVRLPRRARRPGLRPRGARGMAAVAAVPIVNLLSRPRPPVQALADLLTMRQRAGARCRAAPSC